MGPAIVVCDVRQLLLREVSVDGFVAGTQTLSGVPFQSCLDCGIRALIRPTQYDPNQNDWCETSPRQVKNANVAPCVLDV